MKTQATPPTPQPASVSPVERALGAMIHIIASNGQYMSDPAYKSFFMQTERALFDFYKEQLPDLCRRVAAGEKMADHLRAIMSISGCPKREDWETYDIYQAVLEQWNAARVALEGMEEGNPEGLRAPSQDETNPDGLMLDATPETDAFFEHYKKQFASHRTAGEIFTFAKTLERQREAGRSLVQRLAGLLGKCMEFWDNGSPVHPGALLNETTSFRYEARALLSEVKNLKS